jgi:inner membrane protein
MENYEKPKIASVFESKTAKMILVGFLILVLLVPLHFVSSLIEERGFRQQEVVVETSEKWGEGVYFYGPILKIPYKKYTENETINEQTKQVVKTRTSETYFAYFFPNELHNSTDVPMAAPLERGLYKSNVFSAKMNFKGNFTTPNFEIDNIKPEDVDWEKATMLIKTTNMKSIKSQVAMQFGENEYLFEPTQSDPNDNFATLETSVVAVDSLKDDLAMNFSFNINYNASKEVKIIPIGKTTEAKMKSDWHSPSFTGNYLPSEKNKKVDATGFTAEWQVLHLNRPFAQQNFVTLPDLSRYAFGVDFITPVDEYQQNERAAKYGFLVIGLTFLIFFLIQSISKINIHIFQYTMIGLALIMFYTLLISITEHSSFTLAYLIAGSSVVILISLYSIAILKNKKFPAFIGASLTVLYTFIFVIIQMEDYALLVGSIGLFLILASVMYFSRRIDWN